MAKTLHKDAKRVHKFISAVIKQYGKFPSVKMVSQRFNLDPNYYIKTGYNFDQTCDYLMAEYVKDQVNHALNEVQYMMSDGEVHTAGEYLEHFKKLQEISLLTNNQNMITTADWKDILEYYQSGEAERKVCNFGFPILDEITGGICEGDFILIYANVSEGKSTFARSIAGNVLDQGKRVLYFTLEESGRKSVIKTLSTLCHFNQNEIFDGKMSEATFSSIQKRMGRTEGLVTFVDKVDTNSISDLTALLYSGQFDLFVIDQIPLMTPGGNPDWKEMTQVTRSIKHLTQQTKIPGIALTQEQRKGKKAKMEGIAYAYAAAQDCDKMIYIHPDDPEAPRGFKKFSVLKNRDKERNVDFELIWDLSRGIIKDESATLHFASS